MTATTAGSGPTHPGPTRPTRPTSPPPPPPKTDLAAEMLTAIDHSLIGLLGVAVSLPRTADRVAICGQEILKHRLRMARKAVAELRSYAQSPVRRGPSSAAVGADAIATPGGPVENSGRGGKDVATATASRPDFSLPHPSTWPGRAFPVHQVSPRGAR